MPRYNRNDYSACDWRVSKSDILRNKKDIIRKRKLNLASAILIMAVCTVCVITLAELWRMAA